MTCEGCPLAEKKSRVCVPGYFPQVWNGLAFVGEQPWTEEAAVGQPFVGASGRLLWSICKQLGIDRTQVLVLNAISCYAGEWPKGAAEKKAKGEARRACLPLLWQTLEQWKPRVVVALGGEAARALIDERASVGSHRGTVNRIGNPDAGWQAWLTVAEHPAAILRSSGFTAPLLRKDLLKAWRWLCEGAPQAWATRIEDAPSVARVRELCAKWRAARRVTADVETIPAGGRWYDELRLIGLGDEDMAAWFPMGPERAEFYGEQEWLEVRAELRRLFADAAVVKEFQNKQYDMAVLERAGFPVAGTVDDTMVMHHVLHLRDVPHDLGYIAAEYLDVPAWKKEFEKEWMAPVRTLGEYNGNDVLATARVSPRMRAELGSRGLWATYVMDRDATDVALAMNRNGIWIDKHRWRQYVEEYSRSAAELEAQVLELSGAADRQVETIDLVNSSGVLRWREIKVGDIEGLLDVGRPTPDIEELANVCELVAGRVLQPATARDLAESAEKLRALQAADVAWRPWMPLDPGGDPKALRRTLKGLEEGSAAALEIQVLLEQNAEARQLAGKACSVIRSAVKRVTKAVAEPPVNLDAVQQVGQIVHSPSWLGLPVAVPADEPGEYVMNEEAIYHLTWHPVVKTWQGWQSATYRRDWLTQTLPISADGRAHGAFKTTRTPNARWAGGADGERKWNPQNPEKDTIDIFAAPPGYALVGRDFSMIEIRVAAGLSNDSRMVDQINAFDEGRSKWDIHQQRAIRCWPEFERLEPALQKKKRNLAKRANFGPIYGATKYMLLPVMLSQMKALESLAANRRRNLELLEEAQRILDDIHSDWAELFLWLEEGYRRALRDGTLRNGYISGRAIHFPVRDRDHIDRRFCYNAPVQCTAREIVVAAMLRIDRRKPEEALWVMDGHDQLLLECPEEMAEDVSRIMDEEMQGWCGRVRVKSDGGIARTWRELK